ncbi:MAG: thiamine diphosphokinase [Anaerolineae bacterium]
MSRIVIFANGQLNQLDAVKSRLHAEDRIYCADGGTRHALALGLTPHVVVGDLDSTAPDTADELVAAGVTLHRYPAHKDQTDLELTFDWALKEKPTEIMLVGALGGRLDQMLANILLLTRPAYSGVDLTLTDGPQWAKLIRAGQHVTITGQPGDTLSLVPLSATVSPVNFTGVDWPLRDANLQLGSTWSISNRLTNTEATVTIGEGLLLLIHIAGPLSAVS